MQFSKQVWGGLLGAIALSAGGINAALASTLTQQQTVSFSNRGTRQGLFQQFDPTLGTLVDAQLSYSGTYLIDFNCTALERCLIEESFKINLLTFPSPPSVRFFGEETEQLRFASPGLGQSVLSLGREIIFPVVAVPLSSFVGTGSVLGTTIDGSFSILGGNMIEEMLDFSATLTYKYDPFSDPQPIPTPTLLPGLVGMGIAAWRRRHG